MKKNILTIAGLLLLLVLIPLTVNAATIEVDKTEMEVQQIVDVTVTVDTKDVEAIQFDLKFDDTKYKYLLDSADSKLDSTESNLIADDVVRVSAFNFEKNETAQTVTLSFEATATGTSVPFSVVDGTLEATNKNNVVALETFAEPKVTVSKIEASKKDDNNTDVKDPDKGYVNDKGEQITIHPDTGSNGSKAQPAKSIAGVYSTLLNNTLVVPYALATSDDILTVEDIKAEFSNADVTGLSTPVKTGDTFSVNGKVYTVLIYGDVNCDGKVTTADALAIRKNDLKTIEFTTDLQKLAANVANQEDSKQVQQFVLRLSQTTTDTVVDAYPIEFTINDIKVTPTNAPILRGEKTLIANISSTNNGIVTSDLFNITIPENVELEYVNKADGSVDIYATSKNGATFTIKPVLEGSLKLQNGKIEKDNCVVTVKDVTTVTDIALIDANGNEITDKLYIKPGESADISIKYYHTYADGSRVPLTESDILLDRNLVTLPLDNTTVLDTTRSGIKSGNQFMPADKFIDSIILVANSGVSGTEEITLKVQNSTNFGSTSGYKDVCEKTITLDVSYPVVTGIELNGTKVTGEYPVNLYKTEQADNNSVQLIENSNGESGYYTIVDINLLTNQNTKEQLTGNLYSAYTDDPSKINDLNSFVIEAKCGNEDSLSIAFFRKEGNAYVLETNMNNKVDAIGFSYYGLDYYDDDIDNLEQGLTIYFGGTEVNGTVTKNTIDIKITGERTPVSNKAPAKPQTPVEDEIIEKDTFDEPDENDKALEAVTESPVVTTAPSSTPSASATPTPSPVETPSTTPTPSATPVPTETPEKVEAPVVDETNDDDIPESDHKEPTDNEAQV